MRRRSFGKIVRHVLVFCMVTMLMLAGCRQSKDREDAGQDPSQREQTSGSGQNLSGSEKDTASGQAGGLPGSDGGSDLAGSALEESDENKEKGSDQGSMKDIYRVGDSLEDGDLEIPGCDKGFSFMGAAFAMGHASNSFDIDDGHNMIKGHPGTSFVGGVLAAALEKNVSYREYLTALTVSYDLAVRMGLALQDHYGFLHSTETYCVQS